MKKFYSWIICPLVIFVVIGIVYRFYQIQNKTSTDVNLEYIKEHTAASGKLIDPHNEIGVASIDDIRLYVSKEEVSIQYGKVLLEWDYADFIDEGNRADLGYIGITWKLHKETEELKVYYKEEELQRYAK